MLETETKQDYELIIVGAGPAGLTASLYAQKLGIPHIVIEKNRFPKDKICGDAIVPLAFKVLDDLGIAMHTATALHKMDQLEVTFSGEDGKEVYHANAENAAAYNCPRVVFDELLMKEADTAKFLVYGELKTINPEHNSIIVEDGNGAQELRYKHLLLCTGSGKIPLFNNKEHESSSISVASRAYVEVASVDSNTNTIEFLEEVAPGYFWAFPMGNNLLNTGVYIQDKKFAPQLYKIHQQKLKEYFGIEDSVVFKRWPLRIYPRLQHHPYTNISIIGDANHSIDPLLGHGIDAAMLEAREQILALKHTGSFTADSPICKAIEQRGAMSLHYKNVLGTATSAKEKKQQFADLMAETVKFYRAVDKDFDFQKNQITDMHQPPEAQPVDIITTLQTEGYQVVDWAAPAELDELTARVAQFGFTFSNNLHRDIINYKSSFFEANKALKKQFYEALVAAFQPKVEALLGEYDILITNYWEKEPGQGEVQIHQNWTHTDEGKHRSYTIWIPLQDTDRTNGTMEVIPGSHLQFTQPRGVNMEHPLLYPFSLIGDDLKQEFLLPVNLKKGQAVIFDDALIHFTGVNRSAQPRKALQLVVKPKAAKGVFYYKHKDKETQNVEIFDADAEFYIGLQLLSAGNVRPGHGRTVGFFTHRAEDITPETFRSRLGRGDKAHTAQTTKGKGWLKRLKSFFAN